MAWLHTVTIAQNTASVSVGQVQTPPPLPLPRSIQSVLPLCTTPNLHPVNTRTLIPSRRTHIPPPTPQEQQAPSQRGQNASHSARPPPDHHSNQERALHRSSTPHRPKQQPDKRSAVKPPYHPVPRIGFAPYHGESLTLCISLNFDVTPSVQVKMLKPVFLAPISILIHTFTRQCPK